MTNKELQAGLDERKWNESKEAGVDKSGFMPYCEKCQFSERQLYSNRKRCTLSHKQRVDGCYCAKAYRKKKQ